MKRKSLSVKKITHKTLNKQLSDKKILKIYKIFKNNIKITKNTKKIAGAISGGQDSLALAFFLKCFSLERKIKVYAYHIDHKLRKNSTSQAKELKKILKKIDMKLVTNSWIGKKTLTSIQAEARKNRYKLIYKQSCKDKIKDVIFAHTEEDIIENFFIRIIRGSGLEGFVSFNSNFNKYSNKLNILRPLINVKKDDFRYVTLKVFGTYINDPSNTDNAFKRVRIRKILRILKSEGFDLNKILLTVNNLTNTNKAIRYYSEKNICSNFQKINKNTFIANQKFLKEPDEIVLRSLIKIIRDVGDNYYPPRGKQVINLIKSLRSSEIHKSTLSNCVIEKMNNSVIFYREKQKKG